MIAAFLASGGYERHIRSIRRTYAQQIQRYAEMICAVFPDDTRLSRPNGGFVLWVEMPRSVDSELLQKRAMEQRISIAPGTIFSPTKRFRNCIRINCGPVWNDRTRAAIATLGQLAGELSR